MKDKRDDGDYTVTSEIEQCTEAISHTRWQLKCHGGNLECEVTIEITQWQMTLYSDHFSYSIKN